MAIYPYLLQGATPFSQSLIWQMNRSYYSQTGIEAWSSGEVPFHVTNSAFIGKKYALLVYNLLIDFVQEGNSQETVYILELGAGHGLLAFHVLRYLEILTASSIYELPEYKYILSDISEDSLQFFLGHSQFKDYFEKGCLDVCYFDGICSNKLELKYSNKTFEAGTIKQPLITLANYFFDSIQNDLFYFEGSRLAAVELSLNSSINPEEVSGKVDFKDIQTKFHLKEMEEPRFYENENYNQLLKDYLGAFEGTFIMFPNKAMDCLANIKELSDTGMILISMDKGYHDIEDLDKKKAPDMIAHGSMSFWVNFHVLSSFCASMGGRSFFPSFPNHHLELGVLNLTSFKDLSHFEEAYQLHVDDFGPDDYNTLMKFSYKKIASIDLLDIMAMLRLSEFDAIYFMKMLPRIKQLYRHITVRERARLAVCMEKVWETNFLIDKKEEVSFEIGGMFYALGYYKKAICFFDRSVEYNGHSPDEYYNRALSHYQLREDALFLEVKKAAKAAFPEYEPMNHLDKLDLNA